MARRRSTRYSRQRALEQEVKSGLADIRASRDIIRAAADRALSGDYPRFKAFAKIPRADYRAMERLEKRFGVYQPLKSELTPARMRAIRQHWRELEDLFKTTTFAPFPTGATPKAKGKITRALRKVTATEASEATGRQARRYATKKGIFYPTSKRQIGPVRGKTTSGGKSISYVQRPKIGKLAYDKQTGTYVVRFQRRLKGAGKTTMPVVEVYYLAGSEALERKQEILQKRADKMFGYLKRNERLRFIIGRNESRRVFRTMAQLFKYAAKYRKDDQARATFLNELKIEKVTIGEPKKVLRGKGKRAYEATDKWTKREAVFRADNLHEMDPDVVDDLMEFDSEDTAEDDE